MENRYEDRITVLEEFISRFDAWADDQSKFTNRSADRITDLESAFREFKDRKRPSEPSPLHKRQTE